MTLEENKQFNALFIMLHFAIQFKRMDGKVMAQAKGQ